MQNNSAVFNGLVVGHKRDGRCRYDPQVKQELIRQCMMPGVSVARMATTRSLPPLASRTMMTLWSKSTSLTRSPNPSSSRRPQVIVQVANLLTQLIQQPG